LACFALAVLGGVLPVIAVQFLHFTMTNGSLYEKANKPVKAVEGQPLTIMEKVPLSRFEMAVAGTRHTRDVLIAIGVFYSLAGLGMGFLLSRRVVSGLNLFTCTAHAIATGDLSQRVTVDYGEDEFVQLAEPFNRIAERLEENMQALHESEQKHFVSVENVSDGVVIVQDEKFVFCNAAFCKMTGYRVDELVGKCHYDLLEPDLMARAKERYKRFLETGERPRIREIRLVCKNGETRYLEMNSGLIEYKKKKAIMIVLRDVTERRAYQERLRKLSEQLIEAQEEERKRIAHELHDEIGQTLSAISINMEFLDRHTQLPAISDSYSRICEDTRKLALKGIDDIHRISYNLRPHLLDNFGLISALRWLTQDFHQRTGVEVDFQVEGEPEHLSSALETLIFRVVQEALTNVLRHAEAMKVRILFRSSSDGAEIVVEDNGKGFSVKDVLYSGDEGRGLGIFGMKERVSNSGGIFTIVSQEPKGTKLVAEFPSASLSSQGGMTRYEEDKDSFS
jgi:PAS domain S-box-containing protein